MRGINFNLLPKCSGDWFTQWVWTSNPLILLNIIVYLWTLMTISGKKWTRDLIEPILEEISIISNLGLCGIQHYMVLTVNLSNIWYSGIREIIHSKFLVSKETQLIIWRGFALKGIVEGWGQNEIKCQAGNGLGKKRKFYH